MQTRRAVFGLPLVVACVLALTGTARAVETLTVTRLSDDGTGSCSPTSCTLRDAITVANASLDPDITILLPAGTLTLTKSGADEDSNASGDIDLSRPVTIRGQGASATTVQQTVADQRVFDVQGDTDLTLQDLGVAGGQGHGFGGGIKAPGGQLSLERVTVHDNAVGFENGVQAFGGGIYKDTGSLLVTDSAIFANKAGLYGGGVYSENASADIENTTISGNQAMSAGGGLYNDHSNAAILAFDTITGNMATSTPGGVGDPSHYRIRSSIIASNDPANCQGGPSQDQGGNVGDSTCFNQPSDALVTDPLLAPLGGVQVPVEEPLAGSPALDRAVGPCPATDARGVTRPQGAACDSGAAERPVAGGPPGGGSTGKAPRFRLASKLTVAANLRTIALKLACPTSAGKCTGSVKIVGTVARSSAKKKTRKVTIASGRYSITGGKHKTIKLKVSRAGRKALRGHKSLKAKLTVSVTDAAGHKGTQSRTVRLARAKKKH